MQTAALRQRVPSIGRSRLSAMSPRRLLRTASVGTLLGAGATIVSIGAFATVVGIGEVQIASTTSGGSGNLWANPWASLGTIGVAIGLVLLVLATAAAGTQARARLKFPDLQVAVLGLKRDIDPASRVAASAAPGTPLRATAHHVTLQVHNRELSRNASIGFVLVRDLDHEVSPNFGTEWGFPSQEQSPLNVGPGLTQRRTLTFDTIPPDGFELAEAPWQLQVSDISSGRSVSLSIGSHVYFDRTNWKAL